MKRSRILTIVLALLLICGLMAGCYPKVVVLQEAPQQQPEDQQPQGPSDGTGLRVGVSITSSLSSSASASEDAAGLAQADINIVAVTVDDNGVITDCVIDAVQSKVNFDSTGAITTDLTAPVLSKNQLGDDYGMRDRSSIGLEWNQQAAALADYVVGMTLQQVKDIALTESGSAADADLASSVTISIGSFLSGIQEAVENASYLGSSAEDRLALATSTSLDSSSPASEEGDGLAQTDCTIAVLTLDGDTITGCYIDAVQAKVNFDATGAITTDLSSPVLSKNQLGDDYGMRGRSSIGLEWYQQAANFASYVTGKTVQQVSDIALTESGSAADADLSSSVTIGIGDFISVVEMAETQAEQ